MNSTPPPHKPEIIQATLEKPFARLCTQRSAKKFPSKSSKLQTININYISEENGEKRHKDGDGEVEEKIPYPKSIFFILSMEACERFSYYGMRSTTSAFFVVDLSLGRVTISFLSAVLSLYLKYLFTGNGMKNDEAEDLATSLYHGFVFFCYFTSLFGAYLADSFLGKFKTIFYISIIYTIGQAVLSLGSFPDTECGIAGMPQE